jgi:hypothetical protein
MNPEDVAPHAHSAAPPRSRARLQRALVRIALAAVVVLPLWELGLRRLCFAPIEVIPAFGSILAPDVEIRWAIDGDGASRWNAAGVRGAVPPDPQSPSVLVRGDSFTEALMLDDDETFPVALAAGLRDAGVPLPVLNAGASGLSLPDYIERAVSDRERFRVAWSVVQLRDDDLEHEAWDTSKTHFARAADGTLRLEPVAPRLSRIGALLRPLTNRSALLSYGRMRALEFARAARAEPPLFSATSVRASAAPRRDYPIEDQLALLNAAWQERVTVLYLAAFDPERPREPASDTERRLFAACAARGWSCVNLRESFPEFAARWEAPYGFANSGWNTGHMNAAGHRAAGALLARELVRALAP